MDKNVASVGIDDCVITRDEDGSVVKVAETMKNKEGCSSASGCGKENPWNLYKTGEGKNLVDIVNASKLDNKLLEIPNKVNENESEVVIFDDEIIDLGSEKWNLTVCGQFSGCSMSFNEAMYHLRRMWNRFGLRDIIVENAIFYFKFQDEEEIKEVINNGPWIVNNKPIALASSFGKPIIMDEVTTRMCVTGVGRIRFARVLIEIDAKKEIKDIIEIIYKRKNVTEGTKKFVDVEYAWKPSICAHCKVFRHEETRNPRENTRRPNAGKYEYKKRMDEVTNVKAMCINNKESQKDVGNNTKKENNVDEDELVPNLKEREIVDVFVKDIIQPTEKDKWSSFMKRYYKDRKEIIDVMDDMVSENVVEEVNGADRSCLRNEVDGRGGNTLA
ncbi:zinc knuckle CX2CX4HX4C containing protein [Tanacetum coccineum]